MFYFSNSYSSDYYNNNESKIYDLFGVWELEFYDNNDVINYDQLDIENLWHSDISGFFGSKAKYQTTLPSMNNVNLQISPTCLYIPFNKYKYDCYVYNGVYQINLDGDNLTGIKHSTYNFFNKPSPNVIGQRTYYSSNYHRVSWVKRGKDIEY